MAPLVQTRTCKACRLPKPLDAFYTYGKNFRRWQCIECYSKIQTRKILGDRKAAADKLLAAITDEAGLPLKVDELAPHEKRAILQVLKQDNGREKVVLLNHPETLTPEFAKEIVDSAALLTFKFPAKSCSCCRTAADVDDRGSYRVCKRCAISVDVCGRCVLHGVADRPNIYLREELRGAPEPSQHDVLELLGENKPIVPRAPSARGPDGRLLPEADD